MTYDNASYSYDLLFNLIFNIFFNHHIFIYLYLGFPHHAILLGW